MPDPLRPLPPAPKALKPKPDPICPDGLAEIEPRAGEKGVLITNRAAHRSKGGDPPVLAVDRKGVPALVGKSKSYQAWEFVAETPIEGNEGNLLLSWSPADAKKKFGDDIYDKKGSLKPYDTSERGYALKLEEDASAIGQDSYFYFEKWEDGHRIIHKESNNHLYFGDQGDSLDFLMSKKNTDDHADNMVWHFCKHTISPEQKALILEEKSIPADKRCGLVWCD